MLISQLEEGQEGGVQKGGTWRTLRVPDRTLGGQGHLEVFKELNSKVRISILT